MSDHIPVEMQVEIMKRLPVKSLIQFRSVSKTWKSLIDSSDFIIKHYNGSRTQVQHLLVKYDYSIIDHDLDDAEGFDFEEKYVSIVDDHTFPEQKVSPILPPLVEMLERSSLICSSHGLLGLYSHDRNRFRKPVVVLWNPSIRKAVGVVVPMPNIRDVRHGTAIGFGVCLETNDPKIVKITFADRHNVRALSGENVTYNPPEVEVFTLSTGAWRKSYGNLPRESVLLFPGVKAYINGVFYWLATDQFTMNRYYKLMIISFDMTSEELTEIPLPDRLKRVSLHKLGESLVVVGVDKDANNLGYDVWMMGDGVPKSFTKLFTFTINEGAILVGFQKSGEPIISVPKQGEDGRGQLAIYEPHSKQINNIGVEGLHGWFFVCNYMETLLLLDQPDLIYGV